MQTPCINLEGRKEKNNSDFRLGTGRRYSQTLHAVILDEEIVKKKLGVMGPKEMKSQPYTENVCIRE